MRANIAPQPGCAGGMGSSLVTTTTRKEALTAKAFLKLAKCRRMLCSRALLLAIRGGPMGDYWEATKKTHVAYIVVDISTFSWSGRILSSTAETERVGGSNLFNVCQQLQYNTAKRFPDKNNTDLYNSTF